jgi:hypothetical protein
MIYGNLNLRDRIIRATIGAIIGGSAGFLLMLGADLRQPFMHDRSSYLLPMTLVGALIGGLLAFRREKI